MGGKASGRQPMAVEIRRREAIRKAWEFCDDTLSDKGKSTFKARLEIAKTLSAKDMPTTLEGNPDRPLTIVQFTKAANGATSSS